MSDFLSAAEKFKDMQGRGLDFPGISLPFPGQNNLIRIRK